MAVLINEVAPPVNESIFQPVAWYYRVLIKLAKPLYRMQIWLRSRHQANYKQEINQRFVKTLPELMLTGVEAGTTRLIWFHAVSLGETNTAAGLIEALVKAGYQVFLTNTTRTGFNRAEQLFAQYMATGQLYHSFVAVDDTPLVKKFINHIQPCAVLFMETELWANTLNVLWQHNIPAVLVNGRLSAKSFHGYQRFARLSTKMVQQLRLIIVQDKDSAKRFRQLGAQSGNIRLAGSLKWSIYLNPALVTAGRATKQKLLVNRRVLLAASTHAEEETAVLTAFKQLKQSFADVLLIIVPRHPERFDEVAKLIDAQAKTTPFNWQRHSQKPTQAHMNLTAETAEVCGVYLADSMGELVMWYAMADMAFVGGSLVAVGGHNPIEAAKLAVPVVMGQYTQSCQAVVEALQQSGGLKAVQTTTELTQVWQAWLTEPASAKQAGLAGQTQVNQYDNALTEQLTMIVDVLEHHREQKISQVLNV